MGTATSQLELRLDQQFNSDFQLEMKKLVEEEERRRKSTHSATSLTRSEGIPLIPPLNLTESSYERPMLSAKSDFFEQRIDSILASCKRGSEATVLLE